MSFSYNKHISVYLIKILQPFFTHRSLRDVYINAISVHKNKVQMSTGRFACARVAVVSPILALFQAVALS